MTSALENLFAMQLDAAGLGGYVREFQAIRKISKKEKELCFTR